MTGRALLAVSMVLVAHSASAASAAGSSALALAALVADHSPVLSRPDRKLMARLLDGRPSFSWPANKGLSVKADAVTCRASNVDISSHSCELTFGKKKTSLQGRKAHELFATVAEVGVPSDGAAGSVYESLSHLTCAIDPNEIKQKGGGGAHCKFDPGPP